MNMSKVFKLLLVLIFLLTIATPGFAQTPTTTFRDKLEQAREKFLSQVEERERKASEGANSRKTRFKERVAKIRDERKKLTVEKAQKRLEEINKKRTSQMAEFLARTETILSKIEARGTPSSAIADAKKAIETAKTAVRGQAGKTYIIEVGNEQGLKNAVGQAMKALQTDLRNTHKIVIDAKQAVQKVFSLIKGKSKENE